MQRQPIRSDDAPRGAGPYSPALAWGDLVFVSGQVSLDPKSNEVVNGTFREEALRTFANVRALLQEAGSSLDNALRVTVYLADLDDFAELNEIYAAQFSEPYPTRTTVGAALLKNLKIEIDVIATRG